MRNLAGIGHLPQHGQQSSIVPGLACSDADMLRQSERSAVAHQDVFLQKRMSKSGAISYGKEEERHCRRHRFATQIRQATNKIGFSLKEHFQGILVTSCVAQ